MRLKRFYNTGCVTHRTGGRQVTSTTRFDDKVLEQRIRPLLAGLPGLVEKRMFGGTGFIVLGNMACGVNSGELIVRVGPDRYAEALARPYARQFDMTGRAMRGWVTVAQPGFVADKDLRQWVQWGVDYALSLPPK